MIPIGIRKAAERIAAERAAEAAAREASVLHKLNEGLKRSSSRLAEGLAGLAKRKIDRESLDELEELLITSDMGTKVGKPDRQGVLEGPLRPRGLGRRDQGGAGDRDRRDPEARARRWSTSRRGRKPRIVLFVGVNGSGKTTTIGKIAAKLSAQGADIVLAAATRSARRRWSS